MPTPSIEEPISFARNIQPQFRSKDRESMMFAFDLWDLDDVRTHASSIVERVEQGTMPCDGGWSSENVGLFKRWIESGMPA